MSRSDWTKGQKLFECRVKQSAEPQTAAVPFGGVAVPMVSLLGRPITSRFWGHNLHTGPVFSIPHLSPRSVLLSLFKKVAKINLKVR